MKSSLLVLFIVCLAHQYSFGMIVRHGKFFRNNPRWAYAPNDDSCFPAKRNDVTSAEKNTIKYYVQLSQMNKEIGECALKSLGILAKQDGTLLKNKEELLWKLEEQLYAALSDCK